MGTIDLDTPRAARREAKGESPTVRFGGQEFVLPIELPAGLLDHVDFSSGEATAKEAYSAAKAVLAELLTESDFASFMAAKPSMPDLEGFLDGLINEYGLSLGESGASETSSANTSGQ